MTSTTVVPNIFDMNNLTALKGAVKKDDPKAIKSAAQQFEALFMQMVMKSMRDATPHESMFDSEQSRMYESLLDQQMSQVMSSKNGVGLAAMIEKQLTRNTSEPQSFPDGLPLRPETQGLPLQQPGRGLPLDNNSAPRFIPLDRAPLNPGPAAGQGRVAAPAAATAASAPASAPVSDMSAAATSAVSSDFIARMAPYAAEASRTTGIPAPFLVAQAALETGWGRSEPRGADGRPSNNPFGIKAGRNWQGAAVEAQTTEYVDGVAQRQTERFRAYASYGEAFSDYANMLKANPRYSAVLGTQDASAFAQGLQRAGYATDPQYADKLTRIIGGMARTTTS